MRKILSIILSLFIFLYSCDKETEKPEKPDKDKNFEIVGGLEMTSGPHDLAVKGSNVFACRDDKIYIIDISDVKSPVQAAVFDDLEAGNNFEALYLSGNTLYAGCKQTSGVYAINVSNPTSPSISAKNLGEIYAGNKLKAFDVFAEGSTLWAAGSNGNSGLLVKFKTSDLSVVDYYQLSGKGNAGEGVWTNSTHVFMSTVNGHIYAFNKSDISAGYVGDYTFTAEPGHEHWGRSIVGKGNQLYWADWGAGFITVNISDPKNLKADALITHSSYKKNHPKAEGTNVYDVLIHKKNGKIYAANGWSGLLEIDPKTPGKVANFVDYKENQYYCIEQYDDYVILGDIAGGISDYKGIKIIKVVK